MIKSFTLCIACTFLIIFATAQPRYLVRFKDKGSNPYSLSDPSQFLGPRGIARRARYNILLDSLDLPVTPRYVDSVRLAGDVTILNTSKWLNEVAIRTSDAGALAKINALPFVVSTTEVATFANIPPQKKLDSARGDVSASSSFIAGTTDYFNYGYSHGQVHLNRGEFLHNHGFRGEGMDITFLDAGFYHYQTLPTFDSIRLNNRIIETHDFVDNEESVNEDDTHGEECLSTIAANLPGVFVGTAPEASFSLYRTEDVFTESKVEEHNMAAGFERADSLGADVCTISLGYNEFDLASTNYTYADLNGHTTLSAIAAGIAVQKGMLPVIAAGNEGQHAWHNLTTPGDAINVLTVGAVDTAGNIAGFSSYGPSADGRVKPDLAAVGLNAIIASNVTGQPVYGSGTSFATPNLAGLTACLWQAFPEFNNLAILNAMQLSGDRHDNPDMQIGYGIADMQKAFVILLKKSYTQAESVDGCTANFQLNVKEDNSMNVVIERKESDQLVYTTLQTIAGTGSFTNKALTFSDDLSQLVSGGAVEYRVRLDIGTDTTVYLDSLSVDISQTCVSPTNAVAINPNPVSDYANVIISRAASSTVGIVMVNSAGQRVYKRQYQQAAGTIINTINMQGMSGGVYFLSVFADNKKVTTQRILKK